MSLAAKSPMYFSARQYTEKASGRRGVELQEFKGVGITHGLQCSSFLGLQGDPKYEPQKGTTIEPMGRA